MDITNETFYFSQSYLGNDIFQMIILTIDIYHIYQIILLIVENHFLFTQIESVSKDR